MPTHHWNVKRPRPPQLGPLLARVEAAEDDAAGAKGDRGARPEGGGLRGIADRVDALGGRLRIDSPRAGGTRIAATLPP
jgi:glucose-6-phosphate-specific signal transduction histidine kinase